MIQRLLLHSDSERSTLTLKSFTGKISTQGSEKYLLSTDGQYYHVAFLFPIAAKLELEKWLENYKTACRMKDDIFGEIYAIRNKHSVS